MNLVDQIPLVERRVRQVDGRVGVVLSRTYLASARELWESCTDPSRLEHWFEPVSGKLTPGGRVTLADSGTTATVDACTPEEHLQLAWDDGTPGTVTVELSPADRGTRLTLTHLFPTDDAWEEFGPAATGITWDSTLAALAFHLAPDTEMDEEDGETFLRRVVAAWEETARDGGVDEHAAARRSRALLDLHLA